MPIPAYCPSCKSIFPFTGLRLLDGATVGLQSIGTNCPSCGGTAIVGDGIYQEIRGAVELLSGPDSTREMMSALKTIAERLSSGKINSRQAIEEAEAISPRYGQILSTVVTIGLPAVALLISFIGLYLQYENNQSSGKDAQRLLDELTEQTFILKDIQRNRRIERDRQGPSTEKSNKKSAAVKSKSNRRADRSKMRREKLKARRIQFGGARTH